MRHRPSYVPADARYVPVASRTYRPAGRPSGLVRGALVVLAGLVAAIAIAGLIRFANHLDDAAAPASQPFGDFVTPSAYEPGPDGEPGPLPTVVAGCCR